MAWQSMTVAVLVASSFVYAAWALLPAAWRTPLARGLIGHVPGAAAVPALQRAAQRRAGGCGCSDCPAAAPPARRAAAQPVRIVRRG